ncbi:MAG: hypothetical protein C0508_07145 [Cyanobacteria bacterium PR.023]|nr:hypothetical protein [Cyanobacteria bacterium PR.023]
MTDEICKSCNKPALSTNRSGSITSYFFQQNYCQCKSRKPESTANAVFSEEQICTNCGKARPLNRRAGSFTSFLFKELRCNCAGSSNKAPQQALNMVASKHTTTASRLTQRQKFTRSWRSQKLPDGNEAGDALMPSGTVIAGVFRIVSLIGMGGMGVVYLAEHMGLHRQFALKILAPELVNEQHWLRFKAEAKTMASLNHTTFVKVYDLGIHDQAIPFYSMDYLKGRSLEEILVADGPLPLNQAIDVFLEVLDGLAYAHRNGIIHRDIKPGNIMLCAIDGAATVKVLDFGISKIIGTAARSSQSLTYADEIIGSPFYMSPEQCNGEEIDARSDIYSIGCTFFEAITGFVPFEGNNSIETITMHQDKQPPSLSDVIPDSKFPPSLDLVLGKCLAKLPKNRYQSAKQMAIDLQRIKEGKDLLKYSSASPQHQTDKGNEKIVEARLKEKNPSSENKRHNSLIWRLIAASLLVITALASVFLLVTRKNAEASLSDGQNRELSNQTNPIKKSSQEKIDSKLAEAPSTQLSPADVIADLEEEVNSYYKQHDYSKAEPLARRQLALVEKNYSPNSQELAHTLGTLSRVLFRQAKNAEATLLLERQLRILELTVNSSYSELRVCRNNLANIYRAQGRTAEAQPILRRMIATGEKKLGPYHPEVANRLNELALSYSKQGDYAKAEPLFKRALAIYEKAFGPNHQYVAIVLRHYADLLIKTNKTIEARKLRARAAAIDHR